MAFSQRVIRMRDSSNLSEIEGMNDASAIAAESIEMVSSKETNQIGAPRASSLYGACMRKLVLGTLQCRSEDQWEGVKDRLTYGIGNAIHFWVQNTGELFGSRRRGWWRCTACNKVRYFGAPPRSKCENCGARKEATIYHEHSLKMTGEYEATGHPDMFFEKVKGIFRLAEIKSISGDAFPKLKAPMIQHEWQLLAYMWGCAKDKTLPVKTDPKVGYVVYVSKKHHADILPVKMFVVKANRYILDQIKAKLKSYKAGIKDPKNSLPERASACTKNFQCYQASSCVCRPECKKA